MDFTEQYPDTSSSVSLAARRGDVEALRAMKRAGKPCTTRDNRGWYPLHEAAYWSNRDCLELLLQWENADVNCTTYEGETALWLATKNRDVDTVTILLRNGSANHGNTENVTPLHLAATSADLSLVKLLVSHGADVNAQDFASSTPLHEAVLLGCTVVVQYLLEHGANPNIRDEFGRTALFCAAEKHRCEIVDMIVPLTSEDNIRPGALDGTTCLMLAAHAACSRCTTVFIDKGCDINAVTKDGFMAIHFAMLAGNTDFFQILVGMTDLQMLKQLDRVASIVELGVQEQRYDELTTLRQAGLSFVHFPVDYHVGDTIPALAYFFHTDGAATDRGLVFFNSCPAEELQRAGTVLLALMRNWNRIPESLGAKYLERLVETCGQSLVKKGSHDCHLLERASPDFLLKLLQLGVHLEHPYELVARNMKEVLGEVRSLKDCCRTAIRSRLFETQRWSSLVPAVDVLPLPSALKSFVNFHS